MTDKKGSPETRVLLKALLSKYPDRASLAQTSKYSVSYIHYLCTGSRVASKAFCTWAKLTHPDLLDLCKAVQLTKLMD